MTTSRVSRRAAVRAPTSIFGRILVGVDGRKLSLDACRQANRLAEPGATIEAAIVSLFPPAAADALGVEHMADTLEQTATSALSAAGRILGPHAELRRLDGLTVEALLAEAKRLDASLLAIGAPEHRRMEEILLGGVAGELLHRAPCSMLLARPVPDAARFPRDVVIGIDGSQEAERAHAVAQSLATRLHGHLRSVVAVGGKHVDLDEIRSSHPDFEAIAAAPVPALVEASSSADLLVVGSRGLHGPRALGSVSERLAHQATCSVLVIR